MYWHSGCHCRMGGWETLGAKKYGLPLYSKIAVVVLLLNGAEDELEYAQEAM